MEIFIDIETIPSATRPELHEVKVDARLKDQEKVKAAQQEGLEDSYRKQALDSMAGRIWCIGVAFNDEPAFALIGDNEAKLISQLGQAIFAAQKIHGEEIMWVGHNAVGFDMKWLWRKAHQHGNGYIRQHITLDRYKGNVRDTMLMWACGDSRDYVKLDMLAKFLGVGEKTPGMDGSKVYDLWLAGDADACAEYCRADVELTRAVYRRLTADI
jgi:predicted PolB exonuclease-like 3'-5' exonuclease